MSNLVFAEPIINEAPKSPSKTSKNKCITRDQRPKGDTVNDVAGTSERDRETEQRKETVEKINSQSGSSLNVHCIVHTISLGA